MTMRRAACIVALVAAACGKPAQPAVETARWSRPTGIACEAELVAFDPHVPWDFGSPGDGITGHGIYPFGTFRLRAPRQYLGREVGVVFACGIESRLSPPLAEGLGHVYRLELPPDFLAGSYVTLEDCDFPRVGWVCPDRVPCPPPAPP